MSLKAQIVGRARARFIDLAARMIRRRLAAGSFRSARRETGGWGDGDAVPIVMCVWNRPHRLPDTLRMLDEQDTDRPIDVYLWNNNRARHAEFQAIVDGFTARGRLRTVSLAESPFNLGSIARFYWARRLVLRGASGPVIVIDDDELIPSHFVSLCLQHHDPRAASAFWSWKMSGSYWERERSGPGDRVDHVGPGGMVTDLSLFSHREFFTDIPARYRFLDDVWFSYFAPRHGYELRRLPIELEFVDHETNQYHAQINDKSEFFDYLRRGSANGPTTSSR